MVITSIEKQKKNENRYNVYVDNNYCFSVDYDQIIEYGIKENCEYDNENLSDLIYKCQYGKAMNKAMMYLSKRQQSEQEIRKKLKDLMYEDGIIENVITRLKELNYINDEEFARLWIEDRNKFKPTGRKKLIQELKSKGVGDNIINNMVNNSDCDDLKIAVGIIEKKLGQMSNGLDDQKILRRIFRYLLYRGIEYETAYKAIKKYVDKEI